MRAESTVEPARVLTDAMGALIAGDLEKATSIFSDSQYETQELLQLLEKHRLSGYFHVLVRNTPLEARFQRPGAVDLAAAYLSQAQRAESNLQLLRSISERFYAASIPFLTLKGLGQAQRFLGDIRHRFMWDLDILVHPQDLQAATAQVTGSGLRRVDGIRVDASRRLWGIHAIEFRGDPGKLDLHIALRNLPGIDLDYKATWNNAGRLDIEGISLPVLCDEDTLLMAALGMGSDIQKSSHNLRKIWDVHIMLQRLDREVDWEAFLFRREQEGSLRLVLNVFAFVAHLLGVLDDRPHLARAMSERSDQVFIDCESKAREVFQRPRGAFANRVLFSRLLPVSAGRYWLQWLLTSPVRYLYYDGKAKKARAQKSR